MCILKPKPHTHKKVRFIERVIVIGCTKVFLPCHGIACDICDVSVTHTHTVPHTSVTKSFRKTFVFDFIYKCTNGTLRKVVVVTLYFEFFIDGIWIFI